MGACDFISADWGNLMEVYGSEGGGACMAWGARIHGAFANAMAQASQFIGIGGGPYVFVNQVLA